MIENRQEGRSDVARGAMRGRKSTIYRPPSPMDAQVDAAEWQPCGIGGIAQADGRSVPLDLNCRPGVSPLLFGGRPSHVPGPIPPLVVDSVYAVACGGFAPNVGKEVLKATFPEISWVDVNPSPSPKIPSYRGWVGRPLHDRCPAIVLCRPRLAALMADRMPMRGDGRPKFFGRKTAARSRRGKLACTCHRLTAAIALASPHAYRLTVSIFPIMRSLNYRQASYPLTNHVLRCAHAC